MPKPTSRCIDIRQEHPLLEKFKEWFKRDVDYSIGAYQYYNGGNHGHSDIVGKLITLDQRRERRGREYFEGQIQPEHSTNSFTVEEQDNIETPEKKTFTMQELTEAIVKIELPPGKKYRFNENTFKIKETPEGKPFRLLSSDTQDGITCEIWGYRENGICYVKDYFNKRAEDYNNTEQQPLEKALDKVLDKALDKEKVFGWLSEKGYGAEFGYKLYGFIKDFNLLKE